MLHRSRLFLPAALLAVALTACGGSDDSGGGGGEKSSSEQQGGGGAQGTPLTGQTMQQAQQAAEKAVPGAKVGEAMNDTSSPGAVYGVKVTKPDGSMATVHLSASFQVIHIREDGKGGGGGGHGG